MDLVAYGPPTTVDHVMVWWGDGRVFGSASGGNSFHHVRGARHGPEEACVHFKDTVAYRPDFRAYLRLPFL